MLSYMDHTASGDDMLSRILWISAAGIALIAGVALQDGNWLFGWDDRHQMSEKERVEDSRIDRAIDRSFDKMQVTGSDGQDIDVPVETKRELANAVSRLVKAEADLALLRIGDGSDKEIEEAEDRIDDARADIERAKAQIKNVERAATVEHDTLREEIQREIREDVRAAVREAARN
mgnify:CR=1 FL=1